MNVAVRRVQHSERFGQRALSQIVSRPSSPTRSLVKYVPPDAGIGRLSQSGSRRGAGAVRPASAVGVGRQDRQAGALIPGCERRHGSGPSGGSGDGAV